MVVQFPVAGSQQTVVVQGLGLQVLPLGTVPLQEPGGTSVQMPAASQQGTGGQGLGLQVKILGKGVPWQTVPAIWREQLPRASQQTPRLGVRQGFAGAH